MSTKTLSKEEINRLKKATERYGEAKAFYSKAGMSSRTFWKAKKGQAIRSYHYTRIKTLL